MAERETGSLSLRVTRAYPGFELKVDHHLALEGVTGLFGPSGSGKSTLLRVIAGFEKDAEGSVRFDGSTWQDSETGVFVAAHKRAVGTVFQDARLFPHLSVAGNLAFALDRATAASIGLDEVVDALDLAPLLARDISGLSGGERQRVAIARTLLAQPSLLLFDEPLAALDVGRKSDILPYLETLPARFGIPAIYVSHAANEMARLADNVIVLENGRISATGSAHHILSRDDLQMSELPFEAISVLHVTVVEHLEDLQLTRVRHGDQTLTIPRVTGCEPGDAARVSIRAGDVVLATREPVGISVRNVLRGQINAIEPLADTAFASVSIDVGGVHLKAQLTRHAIAELGLAEGMAVYALVKTASFDRTL